MFTFLIICCNCNRKWLQPPKLHPVGLAYIDDSCPKILLYWELWLVVFTKTLSILPIISLASLLSSLFPSFTLEYHYGLINVYIFNILINHHYFCDIYIVQKWGIESPLEPAYVSFWHGPIRLWTFFAVWYKQVWDYFVLSWPRSVISYFSRGPWFLLRRSSTKKLKYMAKDILVEKG